MYKNLDATHRILIAKKLILIEAQARHQDDNIFLFSDKTTAPLSLASVLITRWILCALCFMTLWVEADELEDYPPEVAALLQEYQNTSDANGSTIPSIFAYRSDSSGRTLIDFESGLIVASSETISGLKQRIVEVLLTQIDPSVIDAHTAHDLGLINQKTKKPFFFNQIKDHDGESIASVWRAERFANFLIYNELRHAGDFSIVLSMVATHKKLAGAKYVHYVLESTRLHRVNPSLVMAIMETESAFNPMARSRSNALGLMQIKADTAGRDYFTRIKGYAHTPNSAYLYQPAQNIEIGSGYLSILADRYLVGINDPKKLEDAVIASYNGGAGNLWRSLNASGNRKLAIARINKMTTGEFYWFLTNRHIRSETRDYVRKVRTRMSKYEVL